MEFFEYSLLAAPLGLVVAVVGSIVSRHLAPLGLLVLGVILGGLSGRWAYEVFGTHPPGFDFGSEFQGYDWVAGFASVGSLLGALLGTWLGMRRRRRRASNARADSVAADGWAR